MLAQSNNLTNVLEPQKEAGLDSSAANILIVDDEELIRDLFCDILGEEGYNIWTAADGNEALEKIKNMPVDLIISDMKMPGMDGLELLEKSKEIELQKLNSLLSQGTLL